MNSFTNKNILQASRYCILIFTLSFAIFSPTTNAEQSGFGFKTFSEKSMIDFALFINFGGILDFGTDLSLEVGNRFSGIFRIQFFNTGLIPYLIPLFFDGNFIHGFGYSGALRYYLTDIENLFGAYIELSAEYATSKATGSRSFDGDDPFVQTGKYLIPKVQAGYRRAGEYLFFEFGAWAGYIHSIEIIRHYKNDESEDNKSDYIDLPVAGFVLSVGFVF